jgi:hypothetical protein
MFGGEHQLGYSYELADSATDDFGNDSDFASSIDLVTAGNPFRSQFERILEPLAERCTGATSEHI